MAQSDLGVSRLLRLVAFPITTGVAYYATAIAALFLTRGHDGIATVWPPSGILLAALLTSSNDRKGWHVAAAAISRLCANLQAHNTISASIGFTVVNVGESMLAAGMTQISGRRLVSFVDPGDLIRFCMAAVIATLASATLAEAVATPSGEFWMSWFVTHLVGTLIVTPLILIAAGALMRNRGRPGMKAVAEASAVFGLVTIVSILTFFQSSYPLLFVPMLTVLIATFRLGPSGAAGGVLIVAVVSTIAIANGSGPPVLVKAGPVARSFFLQFYLLALFASALPVATLLAARTRLVRELDEKMRLLQLAESAAHVGHWRLDTESGKIKWSPEVFRIHGIERDVPPALEAAIESYHVEDRALVSGSLEEAIRGACGFTFTARIVRPDGEIRYVFSRGEIDRSTGEGAPGLFGIIQDITAQVAHEEELEAARIRAEEAAMQATIMAETDQLTGIANRRRTSLELDRAIQAAVQSRKPVSIAMFDIDHFKRINDTFGHEAGDDVLRRVANDAEKELRSGDTLGRFGGEEFVIVLPQATAHAAMMVAERVRAAIEAGGSEPKVTISIGVAELATGETGQSLLRRADEALYAAKQGGRNMLRLAA